MKLLLALLLLTTPALAQTIQNPGFERAQPTDPRLPQDWKVEARMGYAITLDSTVAKTGRRSLLIASLAQTPYSSGSVSQTCTVQLTQPTLVHLRGFVKTDHPAGVGVWWNSWRDGTHQGFTHSSQQVTLQQTDEWQALDLVLPSPPEINHFTFGASLQGPGKVWFDDLHFELGSRQTEAPTAKAKAYLSRAIAIIKKHALVRDSIPWPKTQAALLSYAQGLQTEAQTYPLILYLLDQLRRHGDNHSFFMRPEAAKTLTATSSLASEPQPQARYLGDGIGYIAVPGFSGINASRETAFASQIQRLIGGLDSAQSVQSWVVDLRQNGGGNMLPMIAGLGPLVGEGRLGSFVEGPHRTSWGYRHGASYVQKRGTRVNRPYTLRKASNRIAVLIGAGTGSSGEFTALSFIGRPDVRLFGQPSAGYLTGNADYTLSDGAMLFLASTVAEDRLGHRHLQQLIPDELIQPGSTTSDPTLEAARRWLLKSR